MAHGNHDGCGSWNPSCQLADWPESLLCDGPRRSIFQIRRADSTCIPHPEWCSGVSGLHGGHAGADGHIRTALLIEHIHNLDVLLADRCCADSLTHEGASPPSPLQSVGISVDSAGLWRCGFRDGHKSLVREASAFLDWTSGHLPRHTVFLPLAQTCNPFCITAI